jgi:hypothetical protein
MKVVLTELWPRGHRVNLLEKPPSEAIPRDCYQPETHSEAGIRILGSSGQVLSQVDTAIEVPDPDA